jgi:hypothetical protein
LNFKLNSIQFKINLLIDYGVGKKLFKKNEDINWKKIQFFKIGKDSFSSKKKKTWESIKHILIWNYNPKE